MRSSTFEQNLESRERGEGRCAPFSQQETLLPRRPFGGKVSCYLFYLVLLFMQQKQDFGIGIPVDELEHVFEHYRRVEADNTRYIQGTRLGLAIVRQIAQLHGGKVWAESVYGYSSTFHMTFPVAAQCVEARSA